MYVSFVKMKVKVFNKKKIYTVFKLINARLQTLLIPIE